MEHNWFEDIDYIPSEDSVHFKRELCVLCDAEKYHLIVIKSGKLQEHSYILDGNTQYPPYRECKGF